MFLSLWWGFDIGGWCWVFVMLGYGVVLIMFMVVVVYELNMLLGMIFFFGFCWIVDLMIRLVD